MTTEPGGWRGRGGGVASAGHCVRVLMVEEGKFFMLYFICT